MSELLKAVRLMGPSHMLKLGRAYKNGWDEMIKGYVATKAIHSLLSIGMLDKLMSEGSVDIDAFAQERNLDIAVLRPLCEALYSMGLMERSANHFMLADRTDKTLEVLRGWMEVSFGYAEVFNRLDQMMNTSA